MTFVKYGAVALLALALAGCQKRSSPPEPAPAAADVESGVTVQAWGATLTLPAEWSGGENDAGGFELTDGKVALLLGRHPRAAGASLDAALDERKKSLDELSVREVGRKRVTVAGRPALVLKGLAKQDGGGVAVRLLVAQLESDATLSVMLVGDAASAAHMDSAWRAILAALKLP